MLAGVLVWCVTDNGCAVGLNDLMLDSLSVRDLPRALGVAIAPQI